MKNPFKLEKPKSLPSKIFKGNKRGTYTWEDWENQMKRERPFAFFINQTFPKFFSKIYKIYIKPIVYWTHYNVIKRQNWVRLKKNIQLVGDIYNYYYISTGKQRMEKALISCLVYEIKQYKTKDINLLRKRLGYQYSESETDEIIDIYMFFTIHLQEEIKKLRSGFGVKKESLNESLEKEDQLIKKQEEYIQRLFKIREVL